MEQASSWVVAGRLLLLLGAAAALVSGMALARVHDRAADGSTARYVCPMHPEVVSSTPGDCPICGMALIPATDFGAGGAAGFETSIRVGRVQRRAIAEPVRAAAWLGADGVGTAVLYRDDLIGLKPAEHALFFGNAAPNMGVDAQLLPEPPIAVDASTSKVRFRLEHGVGGLGTVEDVGSLRIASRARDLLVVPSSAVLYSAQGPYVVTPSDGGVAFARRPVEIGRILDSGYVGGRVGEEGAIVVLSGLDEGEAVVTGAAFFAEAERRLRQVREEAAR